MLITCTQLSILHYNMLTTAELLTLSVKCLFIEWNNAYLMEIVHFVYI